MTTTLKQADRVTVSLGRKISDDEYGSYDFHYSYSTDVAAGETVADAQDRAEEVVVTRLTERVKERAQILRERRKKKAAKG